MTAAQIEAFKRAVAQAWNKGLSEAIARALAHRPSGSCGQQGRKP